MWYINLVGTEGGMAFDKVMFLPGGGILCASRNPDRNIAYGPTAWASAEELDAQDAAPAARKAAA